MSYVRMSGSDDLPKFGGLGSDAKKTQLATSKANAKNKAASKAAKAKATAILKTTPQWRVFFACNALCREWGIDVPTLFAQYQANGFKVWKPWSLGSIAPVAVLCDICAQFMEKNPTLTDKFLSGNPAQTFVYQYWAIMTKQGHPELASNAKALLALVGAQGVSPATNLGQYSVAAYCLRALIAGTPDFQLQHADGTAAPVATTSGGAPVAPAVAPAPPPATVATANMPDDGSGTATADGSGAATTVSTDQGTTPVDTSGDPALPVTDVAPLINDGTPTPSVPTPRGKTALYVGGGLGVAGLAWYFLRGKG